MTEPFTVAGLAAALHARRISSVEATQESLARIEAAQPALNAFVTIDHEGALAAARAADVTLARGAAPPLAGVPIAHKDVLMTAGLPTTCASRMLADYVAPYDAHVVARLRDAGTTLVGKTNMDEFAMGSSNENSHFGPVGNPWNAARIPGGSSGGSAAAVAARLVPAATGTDTGGSVRQPAAMCGVTGIKPTYGLCSRYGLVAFASSFDTPGVLAQNAEDCALVLDAMAGHDARDATSVDRAPADCTRLLRRGAGARPLAGLRIGLPREYFDAGVAPDVAKAVEAALAELRALGGETVAIELPTVGHAIPVYYVLAPAEASSNLSRFDGVRYGHRAAAYADLDDLYCRTRAEGFGPEVKRRILIGTYVLSRGYYDAYYLKAQQVRRLIAQDFAHALARCDVIAGPTTPAAAFALGTRVADPLAMYLGDIFTVAANLTGLPAISIPCGFDADGLPIGMQLQGRHFDEATLLDAAHRFQQATDWHRRVPSGYER